MNMIRITALAGILLAGQAFAGAPPTPEERYQAALATLDAKCDQFCGYGINDSPEERVALDTLWDATQNWTVAYLNDHADASASQINAELSKRHTRDRTNIAPNSLLAIAPGIYGVITSWEWTGNVFLVEKRDGRFRVIWDIRNAEVGAYPILKAWRTANAHKDCEPDDAANRDNCGPININKIKLLPFDGQGHPRFALLATYGQLAETTVGGQLSVWTLDGTTARVQWAKPYTYNFEDEGWRQDGDLLHIQTTDWWRTIFACGTCIGRQMNWTLRIRPNGIDDLGKTPVVPELDAFDTLAWRIFKGEKTDNLATPEVHALLAALVKTVKAEDEKNAKAAKDSSYDPNWFSFGMFGYKVREVPGGTELSLNADDLELLGVNSIRIRFQRRGDHLYAVDLVQFREPDTRSPSNPP